MSDLAAAIERARARGEAGMRERAATAATMRTKHPDFAAWIDGYRRRFGPDARPDEPDMLLSFGDKSCGYRYTRKEQRKP